MIDSLDKLKQFVDLSPDEERAVEAASVYFPWRSTDYYASLIDKEDRNCPIRLQVVPTLVETEGAFGTDDPLDEDLSSPVPGVIRVYPDRIAVVLTSRCPVYCRHCLRKRNAGDVAHDLDEAGFERVLSYIKNDPSIRDVLLTGGDPLMLSDARLESILSSLRAIEHVEILRIGTRALCTWPERITDDCAEMLSAFHPLWVNTQFNHPKELTDEAATAVDRLVSRGIPVSNQSVLLKGINDSVEIMTELVRKLVKIRVRPYYLYQAQTLSGTGHFVTTIEEGLAIIKGLRGFTTGFAVPQYILDTPYGKIPLNPEYIKGRSGDYVELESFNGKIWREKNPYDQK